MTLHLDVAAATEPAASAVAAVGPVALLAAAVIGAVLAAVGVAWLTAFRRRSDRETSAHQARYRELLAEAQEAVVIAEDGIVVYANAACGRLFGRDQPPVGEPIRVLFAPVSRPQADELARPRGGRGSAPEVFEASGQRADDSVFDVEVHASPVEFEGREATQAILRDVTSRKRMEAGLRESEERYRFLFERNLAGVYRSTARGRTPRVQPRVRADARLRVPGGGHGAARRRLPRQRRGPRGVPRAVSGARAAS